jgi:diaminohydroxyphosphoribosylaminopyrimidine deaminase / 5-amino-6-(5-phosphoribosylamino)uracil reductase
MTDAAPPIETESIYMRRAFALAMRGWGQTAPNPMVGAVVVVSDQVVGEGYHARFGEAHAEVVALTAAQGRTRGATLYVTLEPCSHHGKTPPCVDAIIAAGIGRVVAAVRDPSAKAGGGAERLRRAGIRVDIGLERDAACELNAPFFAAQKRDRPWVTLKLAISADGAVADPTGTRRWITGEESRREVHRMRAGVDAIAVGIGTVLADDPELTVRDVLLPRVPPRRIVFDRKLRIPLKSTLVRTSREVDTRVIAGLSGAPPDKLAALTAAGVKVAMQPSLLAALSVLRSRDDIRSLLIEAGPRLTGSLLAESLVDRLVIFQSRLMLGERAPKAFAFAPRDFEASLRNSRIVERRQFGEDVMTIYALQDVPCSPD